MTNSFVYGSAVLRNPKTMSIPKFEVNLAGAFQVTSWQNVVLDELKDDGKDLFPPAGPFHPDPSNQIVQTDQAIHVHTQFEVSGALAAIISGQYRIQVFLEQFGGGEASPGVYSRVVSHIPAVNNTYNVTVTIPANEVKPGIYRLALAITMVGPNNIPLPVAGFAELGNLQYYAAA